MRFKATLTASGLLVTVLTLFTAAPNALCESETPLQSVDRHTRFILQTYTSPDSQHVGYDSFTFAKHLELLSKEYYALTPSDFNTAVVSLLSYYRQNPTLPASEMIHAIERAVSNELREDRSQFHSLTVLNDALLAVIITSQFLSLKSAWIETASASRVMGNSEVEATFFKKLKWALRASSEQEPVSKKTLGWAALAGAGIGATQSAYFLWLKTHRISPDDCLVRLQQQMLADASISIQNIRRFIEGGRNHPFGSRALMEARIESVTQTIQIIEQDNPSETQLLRPIHEDLEWLKQSL